MLKKHLIFLVLHNGKLEAAFTTRGLAVVHITSNIALPGYTSEGTWEITTVDLLTEN